MHHKYKRSLIVVRIITHSSSIGTPLFRYFYRLLFKIYEMKKNSLKKGKVRKGFLIIIILCNWIQTTKPKSVAHFNNFNHGKIIFAFFFCNIRSVFVSFLSYFFSPLYSLIIFTFSFLSLLLVALNNTIRFFFAVLYM